MTKTHDGQVYDFAAPDIQCNADKEGASVFNLDGEIGQKRVLAHSEPDARSAYKEAILNAPEYCDDCQHLGCQCEDDDTPSAHELEWSQD